MPGGVSADADGKVTAYVTVRATPPAVNWKQLKCQVTDTTTNEIYQAQLLLNGGNYEAVISGLRPNRLHNAIVWAVNANNIDGATASPVSFTTANATTPLSAPSIAVSQVQSFEVNIDLGAVSDVAGQPTFRRYVLFEKIGGGSFTEVQRTAERTIKRTVSHGTTYQYKVRSEDSNGNESSDSSTASITPTAVVNGPYIVNGSINQGRSYTSTASASGSLGGMTYMTVTTDDYAFNAGFFGTSLFRDMDVRSSTASPGTYGAFGAYNRDASSQNWDARWRYFNA